MTVTDDILIINGRVVTGDGSTIFDVGSVRMRGGTIIDVAAGTAERTENTNVVDAAGHTVMPGVINGHAHGCVHGPSMPSGSLPLAAPDVEYFRNRHLLSGTTTLLNVCGLSLPDEIEDQGHLDHPLDVHVTTAHTPSNLRAAMAIDGKGLTGRHLNATIEETIEQGAKAFGEAGGGQTLGGGAQDYRFIPEAILAATGVRIHPKSARALKEAVLGRELDGTTASPELLEELLRSCGLDNQISAEDLTSLIVTTVMPPVSLSLHGFEELARASERFGLAGIYHHAVPTAKTLLRLTEDYPGARMVAAHANHPSFEPEECVGYARALKARGVAIDVSTLDCITTRWRNGPENFDALIEAGVADTVSTDYAGGDFDSILAALQRIVHLGQLGLPAAVALATGNVSRILPEVAGDRGLLAKGKRADVAIVESHNLARVRHLFSNGVAVVFNGVRTTWTPSDLRG